MADETILVDVINMTIPSGNHRMIPIINQPNPCYGYEIDGFKLKHLIQLSDYNVYEAGTKTLITGKNYSDYFPDEGSGGGGGGSTLISKTIVENGVYKARKVDHVDGYSKVTVNVPNTYTAEDEGKVVNNGALTSQTSTNINSNGTVNTTLNNEVVVNVPNTYTAGDEGKVVSSGALVSQTAMAEEITTNGTVDTTLFNSVTVNISGGGGSTSNDVNFYDYDGTIVQSYSAVDFANLSEFPANPTHEGLTAQGWNWSLADARSYVADYGKLDIGQMYTTSDGKTRLYISLPEGRTSPVLQLYLNANTELDIDWGDGSTHSTFTSTGADYKSERHNYPTLGDYVISITVTTGSFVLQSSSTNISSILWNGNNSGSSPDRAYNNAIKKIEIGNNVTSIGQHAFYYCTSLTSVTIPERVTSISNNAFINCYSLSSITIPKGVTSIGSSAFNGCRSLSSITIPDTVTSIGQYAFYYCYSLSSITIPDSVTSIDSQAFYYCYSLSSVTIPDGVTTIGSSAFTNCSSLSSVTLPNALTSISSYTFYGCYSLSSITIPERVTRISTQAFYGCYSLSSITIPERVTNIDSEAFQNCSSLSSITLPSTLTNIGSQAFYGCNSLSSITIPERVTRISDYAFYYCYSLSSITIPKGVTSIGSQTFNGCYSLSSITIPDTVTSIGQSTFYNCSYMTYIKFTRTTPPTVSNSNAWSNVSTSTRILIPINTYGAYTTKTNYPSSSTYKYFVYGTYASGDTLPTTTTDNYNLTWYASMDDAASQTNPISVGNGNEVYATCTR